DLLRNEDVPDMNDDTGYNEENLKDDDDIPQITTNTSTSRKSCSVGKKRPASSSLSNSTKKKAS
ncbi:unnamed protein product, partial [Rotaria magnacalcarata]